MSVYDGGEILRIAVISDLHAFSDSATAVAPSHLDINRPKNQRGKHPISGLKHVIEERKLSADILLCPGDLGDKADKKGIEYAWGAIQEIGQALHSGHIVGTSGNHDLDSRYKLTGYDPQEFLKQLMPPYPFSDHVKNESYWARHFALHDGDNYRLLVLNSSAYHGGAPKEIDHGRVADNSIAEMEATLAQLSPKNVNVLLCHHHPLEHVDFEAKDYEAMEGGQRLLHVLGSGKYGQWLVIHGHKHHPKLEYASGAGDSPVILSAGSLCAVIYSTLQTLARNEFHIVTLDINEVKRFGLVGRVLSWDWAFGDGWAPSRPGSGLPNQCGFGFRTDLKVLADRIAGNLQGEFAEWRSVRDAIPEVDFLIPQDYAKVVRNLKQHHGIQILELDGMPEQIGRSKTR